MKKYLLIILFIIPSVIYAQMSRSRWKAYRYEVDLGIGASNFLGDLGGANQVGTHFVKDLELSQTRPAAAFGLRYKLSPSFAIHPHLTYGKVAGDDKLTEEFFRNHRNLNFKSNIFEFNTTVEYFFLKEQVGHRYKLRGVRGQRGYEFAGYIFGGLGVFHFNPKGEYEGNWYELQPLGTEGQGLVPSRNKYKRTQLCIPMGFGFKYAIDRRWGISLEYGLRYTFTDYVDDVSKTYYDRNALASYRGDIAAALSDKSTDYYTNNNPEYTNAGEQRGDPTHRDAYMFAIISVNYKLRTGRVSYPIF
ncbi:MAG: DUF6089 family protein [Bacteroidia bacterium]